MKRQKRSIDAASQKPKAPVPVATDKAVVVACGAEVVSFSYWDLWFSVVTVEDFEGDLERLAAYLREEDRMSLSLSKPRQKLNHLRDLQRRLAEVGLDPCAVATADPDTTSREGKRARGRILRHNERNYEHSEMMIRSPRQRFLEKALRGYWEYFPVSPERHATAIERTFSRRFYGAEDSWEVGDRLDEVIRDARGLIRSGEWREALALLRGFITAVFELIERADDSYGMIGDSFDEGFSLYLTLLPRKTGMPEEPFFEDLVQLVISEDYGFIDSSLRGFFRKIPRRQGALCATICRRHMNELRYWDLDHEAEEALTLIGQIAAEQRRYAEYEQLAEEMGSRKWERIILLADAAVSGDKTDLAKKVLGIAVKVGGGSHEDLLARKLRQLRAGRWNSDPKK